MSERIVVPVILCGGSGTRLWPSSREDYPKQFLNIIGDFSLFQNTLLRAKRLPRAAAENIVIVTAKGMEPLVRKQAAEIGEDYTSHIVIEPIARNTAAAIALAVQYILKTFGSDVILCIMPSDHHLDHDFNFQRAMDIALASISDDNIITFGITPGYAHTEYGYLIQSGSSGDIGPVKTFKEKPSAEEAQKLYESGTALWNSGMFLLTIASAQYHYLTCSPDLYQKVLCSSSPMETYTSLESRSFDHEIMERSENVLVVPADLKWADVGSWESIWHIHPKDRDDNVLLGRTACLNSEGCFVKSHRKLIAASGLKDIVIVETEDAILVSNRKNTPLHRQLVQQLSHAGAEEVKRRTTPALSTNPWSMTATLNDNLLEHIHMDAKDLYEGPDHHTNPCFYIILNGMAEHSGRSYREHELIVVMPNSRHTIKSIGTTSLKLLKVSMDSPFIQEEQAHAS